MLLQEFGGDRFLELTEQCRVVDVAYQKHVLQPLRETDDGPTEEGIRILRSRIVEPGRALATELGGSSVRLVCYSNAQKVGHMRDRARLFAEHTKQRLYWSAAKDVLKGVGARRAWAPRWDSLAEQKIAWLGYDDRKRGRRLGWLPMAVGMPVILLDHVNREKKVVAGCRGTIVKIHFDGDPPSVPNKDGEYICSSVPKAVVVDLVGLDEHVTIGRDWADWPLSADGMSMEIRSLQLPIGPDYSLTFHWSQGFTAADGLMVDVVLPPGADLTANYIGLSRVRTSAGLRVLRDFDSSTLRRNGSKANAAILLQRLRGDLKCHEEGSKLCARCRISKVRSAFVCPVRKSTRQWCARNSADRKCLACVAEEAAARAVARCKRRCHGLCGRPLPKQAFSDAQTTAIEPVCKECVTAAAVPAAVPAGQECARSCHGLCGSGSD
eukprot:gene19247-biopygen18506